MGRLHVIFAFVLASASVPLAPDRAFAVTNFTYVSAFGSDASSCSTTAPCLTLAKALTETAPGGTIRCITPGLFNPVTINKSVTIICHNGTVQPSAQVPNAITIDGAGITVVLQALDVDGSAPAATKENGIRFLQGAALFVEDVTIRDFNTPTPGIGHGILFTPSSGTSKLFVNNSQISGNGSAGFGGGIVIQPTGAANVVAVVNNSVVDGNSIGIRLQTSGSIGNLTLDNSTVSNSAGHGIDIGSPAGTTKLTIKDSELVNNGGNGLMIAPTGGAKVNIAVIGSALDGNVIGVRSFPAIPAVSNLTIADTSASNNVGGIHASGKSTVGIIRGTVSGNSSYGITGVSPAAVRIGSSIVNANTLGFSGPVASYGNNQLLGNTTQGSSTPVAPAGSP